MNQKFDKTRWVGVSSDEEYVVYDPLEQEDYHKRNGTLNLWNVSSKNFELLKKESNGRKLEDIYPRVDDKDLEDKLLVAYLEAVILRRYRKHLAHHGKISDICEPALSYSQYKNNCYLCKKTISSELNYRCALCNWYICNCGACGCGYEA